MASQGQSCEHTFVPWCETIVSVWDRQAVPRYGFSRTRTSSGSNRLPTAVPTHIGHTPQQAGATSSHRDRNGNNASRRYRSIRLQKRTPAP